MFYVLENCHTLIIELDLSEGENEICQDLDEDVKNCMADSKKACFPKAYQQLAK